MARYSYWRFIGCSKGTEKVTVMKRLSYNPKVKAYINITSPNNPDFGKTIDISDDIIDGSVQLRLDGLSTATFKLQNKNGKYLGGYVSTNNETKRGYIFTPMDKIIIAAGRITDPFQIFTGYLDEVPAFQLYPDAVTIKASSTIKRLYNTYFDPGLPYLIQYFAEQGYAYDPQTGLLSDPLSRFGNWGVYGGIGELMKNTLRDIAGWPEDQITFAEFPDAFKNAIREATGNFSAAEGYSGDGVKDSPPLVGDNPANLFDEKQSVDALRIMEGLVSRGQEPSNAAAITGNLFAESTFNTAALNGIGAFGLMQWLGGRKQGLYDLAKQRSVSPSNFKLQLDYIIQEITGSNKGNFQKVIDASSLEEKAYAFGKYVERPSSAELAGSRNTREQNAVKAYNDFITAWPQYFTSYQRNVKFVKAKADSNEISKADSKSPGDKLKSGNSERYGSTIVDVALSQVGQKEFPAGSNQGDLPISMVNTYIRSIGMQPGPKSWWCAAFVYWVYSQLGLQNLVPKQPYTPTMWDNLNPNQRILAVGAPDVQPGDIIFYEKKGIVCHVGIVTKVNATTLDTVEGNTGFDEVTRESIEVQEHKNVPITGTRGSNRIRGYGRILPLNDPRRGNSLNSVRGTGSPLVGITSTSTDGGLSLVSSSNGIANSDLANGFVSQSLTSTDSTLSYLLTGDHALANDIPFIEWIKDLNTSSGRVFCSAPNGDFYSFFPDYFGWFNTTPYFYISDIETIDLNIQLSDQDLITHIYGIGPLIGYTKITPIDNAVSPIASVQEEAFTSFIKTNTEITPGPTGSEIWRTALQDLAHLNSSGKWDSTAFLDRYGARPKSITFNNIRNPALLWMATWMEFMKAWAKRYQSSASFTFMPELFPGGRVNIADRIEMFVESVTHSFSYSSGFSTSASLIAPTATGGVNLDGEAERTIRSASQVSNSSPDTGNGGN